jgi:hypothetical protein
MTPKLHGLGFMTHTDHESPLRELNLMAHREPISVWDEHAITAARRRQLATRMLLALGGAVLTLQGIRQSTWRGGLLAGVGGTLAVWALTQDDPTVLRRWVAEALERAGLCRTDPVSDSSAESFPASDAPSWTPTVGTGLRRGAIS